jgi:hypothetical protein
VSLVVLEVVPVLVRAGVIVGMHHLPVPVLVAVPRVVAGRVPIATRARAAGGRPLVIGHGSPRRWGRGDARVAAEQWLQERGPVSDGGPPPGGRRGRQIDTPAAPG